MSSTDVVVINDKIHNVYLKLRANFEQLQKHISFNVNGQPNSFVNIAELICQNSSLEFSNLDERLFMPIILQEGIPTVNALPIWEKLDGEPVEAYELFKKYRMMKELKKQRTMFNLSLITNVPVSKLETLKHLFNWNYRVQAFDEYISSERQLMLEQYRVDIEGKHLNIANKLAKTAFDYLQENESMITPKVALQMLDWAVKLERITTGLNPDGKGTINGSERIQLNVQNNIANNSDNSVPNPGAMPKTEVEQSEEDKDRLAKMVNILNEIGVLLPEEDVSKVVDVVDYE